MTAAKSKKKPGRKPGPQWNPKTSKNCRVCTNPRHKKEDGTLSPLCKKHLEYNRVYMAGYKANVAKGKKKGERSPLPKNRQGSGWHGPHKGTKKKPVVAKKTAKKKPIKKSKQAA